MKDRFDGQLIIRCAAINQHLLVRRRWRRIDFGA